MNIFFAAFSEKVLSSIGLFTVLCVLWKIISGSYAFLIPSNPSKYLHDREDSYAFITGATDGTGLGFAHALAKHGFNLIIHGRSQQKLQRVEAELQRKFPQIKIRQFLCDVSHPMSPHVIDELFQKTLKGVHLTVLVNNVGGMGCLPVRDMFKPFESYTSEEADIVMNMNVCFMIQLTRMLLPRLDHKSNKLPSLVLNLSSIAANGSPYIAIYTGTKGFITSFTKSLSMELRLEKKTNIDVRALIIGQIPSASNIMDAGFFSPTPIDYAESTLKSLGSGNTAIAGYWTHWLQMFALDYIPSSMLEWLTMNAMKGKLDDHAKHLQEHVD